MCRPTGNSRKVGNVRLKVTSTLCTALTGHWFPWGFISCSLFSVGNRCSPPWSGVTALGREVFLNREREQGCGREGVTPGGEPCSHRHLHLPHSQLCGTSAWGGRPARALPPPLGKPLGEKRHVLLAEDFGAVAASSVGRVRWKSAFPLIGCREAES